MSYVLAIFLVVVGIGLAVWALFLALGYVGVMLAGGLLLAAAGLLLVPVDGRDR